MTYDVLKEEISTDAARRISYGIVVYSGSKRRDGTATILAAVCDITEDREAISGLVLLCNRLKLSPIHLFDVVEDFLNR